MGKEIKLNFRQIYLNPFKNLFYLVLLLIPLISNYYKLYSFCLHATDFSIYQQAIFRLANTTVWNPYVTVRNVKIFNDHFDPIILVIAGLVKLFGESNFLLLFFEWCLAYFLPSILILKLVTSKDSINYILAFSFLTMQLTLNAVLFPIHPTAWVILPLLYLCKSIELKKYKHILCAIIVLCFFKEYYPFCGFMLGIYYLLSAQLKKANLKEKKYELLFGFILIAVSIVLAILIFKVRPALLGQTVGYATVLLNSIIQNPIDALYLNIQYFLKIKNLFLFFPLILILFLYIRKENNISSLNPILFCMVPIAAIQFLASSFEFQYGAPFAALFIWISIKFKSITCRIALCVFFISFLTGFKKYESLFHFWRKDNLSCNYDSEKLSKLNIIKKFIFSEIDPKIVASGGIIPAILTSKSDIYQLGLWNPHFKKFNILILCKEPFCDGYPNTDEDYEAVISQCKPDNLQVLQYEKDLYVAKGNFEQSCLVRIKK